MSKAYCERCGEQIKYGKNKRNVNVVSLCSSCRRDDTNDMLILDFFASQETNPELIHHDQLGTYLGV